jgi:hypothetical protein
MQFSTSANTSTFKRTGDDRYVITEWREDSNYIYAFVDRLDKKLTRLSYLACSKGYMPKNDSIPNSIGVFLFLFSPIFEINMTIQQIFSEKIENKKEEFSLDKTEQPV